MIAAERDRPPVVPKDRPDRRLDRAADVGGVGEIGVADIRQRPSRSDIDAAFAPGIRCR
jgi:hypothetical protein